MEPKLKLCSKCRKWKNRKTGFFVKTHKRRDRVYKYVNSECRECAAKRSAVYRAKLKSEGKLKNAQKRWDENRDRKHQLRRNRDWYRMKRGDEFTRPWKRYSDEVSLGADPKEFDAKKVLAYFERFLTKVDELSSTDETVYRINGVRLNRTEIRTLSRWRNESKFVSLSLVDKWCQRFDLPFWEVEEASKIAA